MIGFLGGTCIAFFVVMGDLAPPIIAGYLGIENSERLRIGVMLGKYYSGIRLIIEHTKIFHESGQNIDQTNILCIKCFSSNSKYMINYTLFEKSD